MTDEMSEDSALLAGEYVVGTLPWEERMAFEARLRTDPDLRAHVDFWENELAGMLHSITPMRAPRMLERINTSLFGAPSRRKGLTGMLASVDHGQLAVAVVLVSGLMLALMIKVLAITHILD